MADHNDPEKLQERREKDAHGRTMAALFRSREEARSAIKPLHEAHYTKTWLGTTSVGTRGGEAVATVTTEGFFAGSESLVDALVKRGVDGDSARHIETYIQPGNAVLTIDPGEEPQSEAAEIISRHGGQVSAAANKWSDWPSGRIAAGADDFDGVILEEVEFARH